MKQAIRTEKLPNGVDVVVEEIPLVRSASLGFWLRHGSRHETDSQAGLSHFIEHLAFKGTDSRGCLEIAEAIDGMGGNLDAFTGREYTGFFAKVLDTHFDDALELLAEVVFRPRFDPAEVGLERDVILEEIKMVQDSPDESAHELFVRTFFDGHPLGRPVLGSAQTVASFGADDIRSYFGSHYRSDRLILSVAGNVDADGVFRAATRCLGGIGPGGDGPAETAPVHVARTELRRRELMEQVHLLIGINAFRRTDDRRYALETLSTYLGGSVSSRLFQRVRERLGLAYAINSFTSSYKDCGLLGIYAATSPDRFERLIDVTRRELGSVARGEIDNDHIERVKSFIKADMVLGLESTASRMAFLAKQMIYFGHVKRLDEVLAELDAVTVDDVARVAAEIIGGVPLTVTAIGNLGDRLPGLGRLVVN